MSNKEGINKMIRTPIVAILGHVDHGKTTILDQIKNTDVQSGEVGGITQKISVFTVSHGEVAGGKKDGEITFIDTPGHEAFDLMRSRGGGIADFVLLIIAADDGLKPQTIESIEVIKRSQAKPIVVINKIDLPNINIEKIKRELSTHGILVEGYGGDVPVAEVSGKTGAGISDLLDTINLLVDMEGFIERVGLPDKTSGKAFVLESVKDNSKGYISSIVNVEGTFLKGGWIAYRSGDSVEVEKIKGFVSETDSQIQKLETGHGARLLGLSALADLAGEIYAIDGKDVKLATSLLPRAERIVEESIAEVELDEDGEEIQVNWLTEMFADDDENPDGVEKNYLNVIIKSSSEGSLEAIIKSLEPVEVDGYSVKLVSTGVGDITQKDIELAEVTKSIVLAFEVSVSPALQKSAENKKILVRNYDLIYKLTEEITDALTIMSAPKESEEELGSARIKEIFTLSNGDAVLGGRIDEGIMKLGAKCYIVRDDEIVGEGRIKSLRNQKKEIKEAGKGADFGAILEPKIDAQEGDEIHCFKIVK
jgi:translation initiation factor IF-2